MYVLVIIVLLFFVVAVWTEVISGFRRKEHCDWSAMSTKGPKGGRAAFLFRGNMKSYMIKIGMLPVGHFVGRWCYR